ncbi:GIY-YIG nuclease family protein [Deinococcus aquaticus]|uniref:GIY-YIG nuclease family protein n=1 Tax=Deinococcus aquaticus TaxID=328692 RepID=UPI003F4867AF
MPDDLLKTLGFPDWQDVSGQGSVVGLYPAGQRCGLYVLGFADGERYVGQAVDVAKRFLQHRKTYADLTGITFKVVPKDELDSEEQRCIHALEAAGMLLRNFTHMSVVRGDRPFDDVVTPQEQEAWLDGSADLQDDPPHVHDESLRRRQRRKFEQFMTLPHAQDALVLLGLYLQATVPFPRRTEQNFWTVTCLPYGLGKEASLYCRVNLNMQETFSVYGNENGLDVSIHLAVSPLAEFLGSDWQAQLAEGEYEVTGHRYQPGGQDQTEVLAFGKDHAVTLISAGPMTLAMALLNLRLMRRGACYWPGSHNPQLSDAGMEAFELALPSLGLDLE